MHGFVSVYKQLEINSAHNGQPVEFAMLTADVPFKSALQLSSRDVTRALTARSFVRLGRKRLI